MTDVALACDLAVTTGEGTKLVRVMHGHQFDQYNAFDDPRSPVDTPLGHHVVRQVLPKLATRDQPGSLLEGVRWCNGDPAAFLGSRLLYRMVAGWLWWLVVPFAAALLLRFLTFVPGVKPLIDHHAERWLILFGILIVAIAVVAAVTGIATMLRVNRALADASVSERGDAAAHNAAARAEAARLIEAGYAGWSPATRTSPRSRRSATVFTPTRGAQPRSSGAAGPGSGCPTPFLGVRRRSMVELAGRAGCCRLRCRWPKSRSAARCARAAGPGAGEGASREARGRRQAPRRSHLADRRAGPGAWVRRRRVRRVAAFGLLIAGC